MNRAQRRWHLRLWLMLVAAMGAIFVAALYERGRIDAARSSLAEDAR